MGKLLAFTRTPGGARAIPEIITTSLDEYTEQIARAMLTTERLQQEHPMLIADTIVSGWVVWCQLEAKAERRTEKERQTFEYLGGLHRGDPGWALAVAQVCGRLGEIMGDPVASQD